MKKCFLSVILAISISFIGCSDDAPSSEGSLVSESVLSGTVQGQSFTAKGGKIFDDSFKEEELFSINVTNVEANCDSYVYDYEYSVSTDVPKKTGTYTKRNVVFSKKSSKSPLNVFQSTVIIDAIPDTTITFRIKASSGSDNVVEGKFTLPYCK